jgi:hypothetical protein
MSICSGLRHQVDANVSEEHASNETVHRAGWHSGHAVALQLGRAWVESRTRHQQGFSWFCSAPETIADRVLRLVGIRFLQNPF